MEKTQNINKYHNTKIYKLEHTQSGYYYIGSTTQKLCNRLSGHRQNARRRPAPVHIKFTELGWDQIKIILIEQVKCETKEEQLKEENKHIAEKRNDPLCLNCKMAHRRKGEYYQENKDLISQNRMTYYEENKEYLNMKQREYYHAHKEENKLNRKQYNIDHREHKTDYDREYRDKNKDKIKAKDSIIHTCECGGTFNDRHKARHLKTKKHLEWIQKIQD